MGEIKYNGRTYSGLIQANGCFVDTDNVIASGIFTGSFSYTATEDCFCVFGVVSESNHIGVIEVDGERYSSIYNTGSASVYNDYPVYLRKGQTATITEGNNVWNVAYSVYGLMQGSPITFLSEYASACYDTNEREVGCWVDGKPIYQKTVVLTSIDYDTNWHDRAHGISNIENIVDAKAILTTTNGYFYPVPTPRANTNYGVTLELTTTNVSYMNNWVSQPDTMYVTLQYTKTTDTAGSGKLTPTGFETHHYSTNEQIVGTWIDGKPLYEQVLPMTQAFSCTANTWAETEFAKGTKKALYKVVIVNDAGAVIDSLSGGFVNNNVALNSPRAFSINANTASLILQFTKTTD